MKNQKTNTLKEQTLALQYPTKSDNCNQQVPFFDPSFFKYKRYFHYFFLPEDTKITIETIKSQQKQDPDLQKVYHWLEPKCKTKNKLIQQKQVIPFYHFTTNSSINCISTM